MKFVTSIDGTPIAYDHIGVGKPLIIIGGSLADHQMYVRLATQLSQQIEVLNYDRRNRGNSGKSEDHTIDNELQDLKALIDLCRTPPLLYGHSAGAAIAIRAAAEGLNISRLVIADLPYSPLSETSEQEAEMFELERKAIVKLLQNNDKIGATNFFLKDFGMNEQELQDFVSSENGAQAIAYSATLPVDYEILGNGLTPINLLRKIQIPILILTSQYGLEAAEDAAKHLSNCRLSVLPGPAHSLSPDEIAAPIINFLEQEE